MDQYTRFLGLDVLFYLRKTMMNMYSPITNLTSMEKSRRINLHLSRSQQRELLLLVEFYIISLQFISARAHKGIIIIHKRNIFPCRFILSNKTPGFAKSKIASLF